MTKNVLIIGATSAVATATARIYAEKGYSLYISGRNKLRLKQLKSDLEIRGAHSIKAVPLDVCDFKKHQEVIDDAKTELGSIDIALFAHGSLPDQSKCEQDIDLTLKEININFTSTVSLLTALANVMEAQQAGSIAVISSVAGDRGRKSNYIYGCAKGAISIFLQGLRNRLDKANVNVLTVKPGFIDSPMTAEFDKGFLWAQPEAIAIGIIRALEKRAHVVYLPWFWRIIMTIIRSIPERIFKKLNL